MSFILLGATGARAAEGGAKGKGGKQGGDKARGHKEGHKVKGQKPSKGYKEAKRAANKGTDSK
jgi:hypothetical protein